MVKLDSTWLRGKPRIVHGHVVNLVVHGNVVNLGSKWSCGKPR